MGAENKFWNTPVLIRELVPFLDLASILNLASVHDITLALIYHNSAWRLTIWSNLLRRTTFHLGDEEVKNAVRLMKLVEDKEVLLLDLLDTICERFPSDPEDHDDFAPDEVKVSCPRHGEHLVHPAGFRLLELAEGKMGTMALQEVWICGNSKMSSRRG